MSDEEKKTSGETSVDELLAEILSTRGKERQIISPVEEDDVRVYTPRPAASTDDVTRRVVLPDELQASPITEPEPSVDDGQLSWEDVTDDVPEEETPMDENDAEVQASLQRAREERIRSFRLERGIKLEGDEESSEALEDEPEEAEFLEDFNAYEDADAVWSELHHRQHRGRVCMVATLVTECLLAIVSLLLAVGVLQNPYIHIADTALLLVLMGVLNFPLFSDALADLREGVFGGDVMICGVTLLTLLHTLLQFLRPETAGIQLLPVLAGFGLTLGSVSRQLQLRRIVCNFAFVSDPAQKWAASKIEDPADANEIGRSAVAVGQPEVVYHRPVAFLQHYLGCSYERHEELPWMRRYMLVLAISAFVVSAIYAFVTSIGDAFTLFVTLCALGTPLALGVALSAPLSRAAARLRRHGGMLVGETAVRQFGDLHALVVDAEDLFPEHTVVLSNLKIFKGTRIDEAILDAAAVSVAAGGPLAAVFRRMIQNRTDLLDEVDTLVYEQEMGLSGWVGGRRVLVGNRRLLENHGVNVPSQDYEMKYRQGGGQLVYLSTAGELSAMFVVNYLRDDSIAQALHALQKEDITLLVRTCDPNITQELVCETLSADDYYLEILGTTARRRYEQLTAVPAEDTDANLAANNTFVGKAMDVVYCRRLHVIRRLLTVVIPLCNVTGVVLCALISFATGHLISALYPLLYQLLALSAAALLPLIKKV